MDKRSSLQEINRAINLTEYEKAIELLLKEIKYSGPTNELRVLLADTYIKLNDLSNATKIYETLYNSEKSNPIFIYKLVELKILSKLYKEAKDILLSIPEKLKGDWQYFFLIGKLNYELKSYDKAIVNLKEAIKRNPKNIDILMLLADISFLINKLDDALRYYLTLLKLDSNNPKVYENLGFIYYRQNKKKESYKSFVKANKLKPNSPNILKMLGLFEIEEGSYKDALKNLEKAYNLDPNSIDIIVFLGYSYEKMGINEKAEELYYKATTISKQNPEPYLRLAQLYQKLDFPEKALKILSEAEKKFQDNEKILIEIGKSALQIKEFDKSRLYFSKILEKNPTSEESLFGLGFGYELKGDLKKADSYYSKLLEINPENEEGLLRKGIIDFSNSNKAGANYYLTKLLEKDPDNFDANVTLGQIKLEDQQVVDALYYLEKAKKSDPKNIQPYLILGEYYRKNNKLKEAIDEYSTVLNLTKYKSIESIEQFNDILENYENVLSSYEKEIKNRNLTILNKFKEKQLESTSIADEEKKKIESSIEKLFDQVDETIGTKIDEIENESIEYNLISKILDGQYTEETESFNKDESSKILDYLSDGIFVPEEVEEEAEEIIEKKSKKNEEENLIDSLNDKDTDIFEKIPFDNLQSKNMPFPSESKKISEDEDVSLLNELKMDNIPASLDEAYNLNEEDRRRKEKEKLSSSQQAPISQPQIMQQPIMFSPPFYQPPIAPQMPFYPQPTYQQPLPQQMPFYQDYSSQKPMQMQPPVNQPQLKQQPESSQMPVAPQTIPEEMQTVIEPTYKQIEEKQQPQSMQSPSNQDQKIIPSYKNARDENIEKSLPNYEEPYENAGKNLEDIENKYDFEDDQIPEFPKELESEENLEFDEEKAEEKTEKKENEIIPDFFEPVEPIFSDNLKEEIPIEEILEPETEELMEGAKSKEALKESENKENIEKKSKGSGIVNLGVLKFGPPKIEVVKKLLQERPKSKIEKKNFFSTSIKELGKYLFSEVSNLPKEIQEKATLSKNFQTFLKFMKKENNDE